MGSESEQGSEWNYIEKELLLGMRAQSMGRDQNYLVYRMREMPQELLRAYFETSYIVYLEHGECAVRLSEDVPAALNELLHAEEASSWAIITAMNPYSSQVFREENLRRTELLRELLELQNAQTFAAVGKGDDGGWEEESFLALGLSYEMALSLGTAFQQTAVLYGERDAVVELIFCDS